LINEKNTYFWSILKLKIIFDLNDKELIEKSVDEFLASFGNLESLLFDAANYFYKENYSVSRKYYELLATNYPDNYTAKNNYAYLLVENDDDLEYAESLVLQALTGNQDNITFLDTYGWILYKKQNYEMAKTVFEKCILLIKNDKSVNSKLNEYAEIIYHYVSVLKMLNIEEIPDDYMKIYEVMKK